jgi:ribose 5-phosphate isomerase
LKGPISLWILALQDIPGALSGSEFPKKFNSSKGGNMKTWSLFSHAILLCSVVLVFNISITASSPTTQAQATKITVPEAEAKSAKAVETAKDTTAKFTAAEEFVKKYPASKARPQIAGYMASHVFGITDVTKKSEAAQKYIAVFTDPTEAKLVKPALIDAYVQLKQFDEAFDNAASYLATDTEDVQIRIMLALAGADLVRSQNVKHIKATREYGLKAIELIEADKKPAALDNDAWLKEKAVLPTLYQQMAVLSLVEQKPADAQTSLEKAVKLNPSDPFNQFLLGSIANMEYQSLAQAAQVLPSGKSKDEMMPKVHAQLDKVIEHFARTIALATGKEQYQQLSAQVLQDLTVYYKYRHNNSAEGLQKYIDGYKLP